MVRWPILTTDSTAIDVSTWTVRAQARPRASSSTVLYSWSSTAGNVLATTDGYVGLIVAPEVSSAWTWKRAVYDVELVDPAGNVTRVDSGLLSVDREVTR